MYQRQTGHMKAYGMLYLCQTEALSDGNAFRDLHEIRHSDHIAGILSEISENIIYLRIIFWITGLIQINGFFI